MLRKQMTAEELTALSKDGASVELLAQRVYVDGLERLVPKPLDLSALVGAVENIKTSDFASIVEALGKLVQRPDREWEITIEERDQRQQIKRAVLRPIIK